MYFRNYGLGNTYYSICLKLSVSEDTLTCNMERGPNTVEIWATPTLPYLLITLNSNELEKISLSYMQSL